MMKTREQKFFRLLDVGEIYQHGDIELFRTDQFIQYLRPVKSEGNAPRGDSLDHFLVDVGQLSRYDVSEKLAQVTAQRDELRADMRCIAESNGEDAVEFAKRSVAKFDPEMYPRLAAIAKAEQH